MLVRCKLCEAMKPFVRRMSVNIFDEKLKTHQKNTAARLPDHQVYDYLKDEVADILADRVADISKTFKTALDFGAGKGHLSRFLTTEDVQKLYQYETSSEMLKHCRPCEIEVENILHESGSEVLPLQPNTFDLVLSNLNLHWVNDLPLTLTQLVHSMKDDGVLIASMFGADTLYELRCSLQLAQIEREGGFGAHVSPFVEMRDVSGLLQTAGLTLTTIDFDEIVVGYPSMFELMQDLKGMGENNASWKRKPIMHRDSMMAASAIYKEMYGSEDGTIPATFQVIYMIGWKPSETQPKPLTRGSATVNFKDLGEIASKKD